jgi:capsular polysaccharide transport system permease protein
MRALATQLQILNALILRETRTRFGRHRLGYVWALLEPLLFIAMFSGIYLLLDRTSLAGLPLVPFLATGFLPFLAFNNIKTQSMNAINGNKGLLFYPDVRPLDLVLARVVLELATYLTVFAIIMGAVGFFDERFQVDSLLLMLVGFGLTAGLGMGLGLVLCGLSTFSLTVERLAPAMMRPLFWVSALFFSTTELPTDAQKLVLLNPLLHAVELTRDGWFPGYHVPQVNIFYPAAWMLVLLYFGLTLERVARRRLELT